MAKTLEEKGYPIIDVHVHPSTAPFSYERRWGKEVAEFMPKYYRIEPRIRSDEEMGQEFIKLNIKAIPIGWDAQAESGYDTPVTKNKSSNIADKILFSMFPHHLLLGDNFSFKIADFYQIKCPIACQLY